MGMGATDTGFSQVCCNLHEVCKGMMTPKKTSNSERKMQEHSTNRRRPLMANIANGYSTIFDP